MTIIGQIKSLVEKAILDLYGTDVAQAGPAVTATKPDFEGDYTVVLFSLLKPLKKSPEQLGQELGNYLTTQHATLFRSFNVIKGFLNFSITDEYWINFLHTNFLSAQLGWKPSNGVKVIIEYSSPNTNKPLHLGHLRNIFLGWSLCEILKVNGYDVVKTCIVNDRGIHINKSMLAWQLFGNNTTPESTHSKGDHFVGNYYVKFDEEYKKQVQELVGRGIDKDQAEMEAPLMQSVRQMLLDWESGKTAVLELWKKMNQWVYAGFDETYRRIGADFDKVYYESDTYLLGKQFVEQGLQKGVFFKKDDGSTWIDLTSDGLDEKLVLRKDGTSVYITQDLGLADEKFHDFHYDQSVYVIGDEQNYHVKVLKLILEKLGKPYAAGINHLSYGMVDLPTGRMKSREGTVVDADDLLDEMFKEAEKKTKEQGKTEGFTEDELTGLYETIGAGGLKFFLLRVDPKKRMVFNPEESIDLHGFTATHIQYTHARIKSILRKEKPDPTYKFQAIDLSTGERNLIILLEQYAENLSQAANEHNPSVLAIYAFNVSKSYNTFYAGHPVINADTTDKKQLRLEISALTANVIASAMRLLGIQVPERM